MFKALIPIVGILIAVGIFFTYVQPSYQEIRQIQAEAAEYADAAARATEIQEEIDALRSQRDAIPLADLERLEALIPDEIDEVAFLNDLNGLAGTHNLALREVQVGGENPSSVTGSLAGRIDVSGGGREPSPGERGEDTDAGRGFSTLPVFFSVSGTYEDMRAFLEDLERSLVFLEIMQLESMRPDEGPPVYSFGVQLYALDTSAL